MGSAMSVGNVKIVQVDLLLVVPEYISRSPTKGLPHIALLPDAHCSKFRSGGLVLGQSTEPTQTVPLLPQTVPHLLRGVVLELLKGVTRTNRVPASGKGSSKDVRTLLDRNLYFGAVQERGRIGV